MKFEKCCNPKPERSGLGGPAAAPTNLNEDDTGSSTNEDAIAGVVNENELPSVSVKLITTGAPIAEAPEAEDGPARRRSVERNDILRKGESPPLRGRETLSLSLVNTVSLTVT